MANPINIDVIFKRSGNPYLVLKADAPKFTIVTANEAFTRLTNTADRELTGHGVFEIFPGEISGKDPP